MEFNFKMIDFYNNRFLSFNIEHHTNKLLTCKQCNNRCDLIYSIPKKMKINTIYMNGTCCSFQCLQKFVNYNTFIEYIDTKNIINYLFPNIF